MKDARYKEIMEGLGMPNSRSLITALQQVANEVAQEIHKSYEKNNKKLQTDIIEHDENCMIKINGICSCDVCASRR